MDGKTTWALPLATASHGGYRRATAEARTHKCHVAIVYVAVRLRASARVEFTEWGRGNASARAWELNVPHFIGHTLG